MSNSHLLATKKSRRLKLNIMFGIFMAGCLMILGKIIQTDLSNRKLPRLQNTKTHYAIGGSIITADNITAAYSQKSYSIVVNAKALNLSLIDNFTKLLSQEIGIGPKALKKRLYKRNGDLRHGYIMLHNQLDASKIPAVKNLSRYFNRAGIMIPLIKKDGSKMRDRLGISQTGEKRFYPLSEQLEPIIGYSNTKEQKHRWLPNPRNGLECYYQDYLFDYHNGISRGPRDIYGNTLHTKSYINYPSKDGLTLHLHVPLKLQYQIELAASKMKKFLIAKRVIVMVMKSNTGELLSLADSNRFDPMDIQQNNLDALNTYASSYTYEAGSVFKPITLSIALSLNRLTPNTSFFTGYKAFPIAKHSLIHDDDYFETLSSTDIIVHSSNIGITKIAWLLTGKEQKEGLERFGFGSKSDIDLCQDFRGKLHPLKEFKQKIYQASSAFGYSITATPMQLLRAYAAFNNGGILVVPRLGAWLEDQNHTRYEIPTPNNSTRRVIPAKTAAQMHSILKEVVSRGTGRAAQYPGLEIGGKTGTAHIASKGGYSKQYHSSFYGFANDDFGNRYTIGVLVIKPQRPRPYYFASQSAVPTFKLAVKALVDNGFLKPNIATTITPTQSYGLQSTTNKSTVAAPKPTPKPHSIRSLFGLSNTHPKPSSKTKKAPKAEPKPHKVTTKPKPIKLKPAPKVSSRPRKVNELFKSIKG